MSAAATIDVQVWGPASPCGTQLGAWCARWVAPPRVPRLGSWPQLAPGTALRAQPHPLAPVHSQRRTPPQTPKAKLALTKTASAASVQTGQAVTFTLTASAGIGWHGF